MPPTANAGTAPAPITFPSLPANVVLNGTGSTPGAGATSIDEWVWVLRKPTGSTATIVGGSTATPVLTGIDLPGTYIVWLRVRNNLSEWSAAADEFHDAWEVMPGAIVLVEVTTQHAALKIKGSGEHNYFAKDEALALEVDRLRGDLNLLVAGEPITDLYIDNVYEKTADHGVIVHNLLSALAGLRSDTVEPSTTDSPVIVRGRGTHTFDLLVDNIGPDSGADLRIAQYWRFSGSTLTVAHATGYLSVNDDSSHEILLAALGGVISTTGKVQSDTVEGKANTAIKALLGPSALTLIGGTSGVQLRANGGVGDASYARIGGSLECKFIGTATTGTAVETMYELVVKANTFGKNGTAVRLASFWSTANNTNAKAIALYINDTIVSTGYSADPADNVAVYFEAIVVRASAGSLRVFFVVLESGELPVILGPFTVSESTSADINLKLRAHTALNAGDITLQRVHAAFEAEP